MTAIVKVTAAGVQDRSARRLEQMSVSKYFFIKCLLHQMSSKREFSICYLSLTHKRRLVRTRACCHHLSMDVTNVSLQNFDTKHNHARKLKYILCRHFCKFWMLYLQWFYKRKPQCSFNKKKEF